jgi:hypothetical protein
VVNNRRCYLYEASEFRLPIVGEVYEMQGEYYRVDTDYHGLPCSRYATKLVVAAHKADRRWLGGVLKAAHETSEPWPGEVANRFREDW